MPIPTKENNETNEEFIERCMSDDTMVSEYNEDQRLAICSLELDDEQRQTNFPNKGDDKKISLINSEEPQFDFDFAKTIKEQTLEIWKAGGNIRGNEAFILWERARDGQDTEAIKEWIKEREAWIKRHFEDGKQFKGDTEPNLSNVGGVIAQIKWGTIGTLGEQGMKDVILELTKKLEDKKEMQEKNLDIMKKHELRHIQKIEETDDSIIIYYGKNVDDVEMIDEQDKKMDDADHYPGHEEEEKTEIRTNPNQEIRTFDVQNLELRMDGDKPTVVGYGAVFNSESNDLGGFREYIAPGAFDGRLEDDVRFLVNHDANLILARTTNGTLRLSVDDKGLKYEADMPNTSTARDLIELLKNGTISQSSFAFIVEDDSWEVRDGINYRTINKVSQLYDVSSVTYPAYNNASSSVALRSMEEWKEKEEAKKDEQNLEGIKEEDLNKRSLNEMRLEILKNKY